VSVGDNDKRNRQDSIVSEDFGVGRFQDRLQGEFERSSGGSDVGLLRLIRRASGTLRLGCRHPLGE